MMDEPENKQVAEALERAEQPKRPADIGNDGTKVPESLADEAGFKRPMRLEQTSEKEHPPGKE